MKIDQQEVGTVQVFSPQGALVDDDAAEFAVLMEQKLKASNPRLVVAMGEVPYLDSKALETLVECSDALRARGSTLKLAAVPATCREIMQLTGLSERFQFFEQVQDAVRSFL